MIANFSIASTGKCNSKVELFTSTSRDFDSTIKFNASTGEEYFRHKAGRLIRIAAGLKYRSQVTVYRLQVTGHRSQVTGYRSQVTGHRSQVTGHRSK